MLFPPKNADKPLEDSPLTSRLITEAAGVFMWSAVSGFSDNVSLALSITPLALYAFSIHPSFNKPFEEGESSSVGAWSAWGNDLTSKAVSSAFWLKMALTIYQSQQGAYSSLPVSVLKGLTVGLCALKGVYNAYLSLLITADISCRSFYDSRTWEASILKSGSDSSAASAVSQSPAKKAPIHNPFESQLSELSPEKQTRLSQSPLLSTMQLKQLDEMVRKLTGGKEDFKDLPFIDKRGYKEKDSFYPTLEEMGEKEIVVGINKNHTPFITVKYKDKDKDEPVTLYPEIAGIKLGRDLHWFSHYCMSKNQDSEPKTIKLNENPGDSTPVNKDFLEILINHIDEATE